MTELSALTYVNCESCVRKEGRWEGEKREKREFLHIIATGVCNSGL